MKINWYHATGCWGAEAPKAAETDWSPNYVYLHKNVEAVTREQEDPETKEKTIIHGWEYDEAFLTRTEYATYLAESAEANVEYVACVLDVDLDV